MATFTKYDAKDWSLTIDGVYITGFDEDMFTWEKDEALGEYVTGACGDSMYNVMNNDLHTLTITLQPTSPSVPFLISMMNAKKEAPVFAINKALGLKVGGQYGRVAEAPSIEAAAEGNPLEFVLQVADGKTTTIKS